jgi:hypothetical protein
MIITVSELWQKSGIKYCYVDADTPLSVAAGRVIALTRLHPTLTFRLVTDDEAKHLDQRQQFAQDLATTP